MLNELSAPEFFDKALFRGFIQKLREAKIVWTDDAGKLDFSDALEDMVRDARVILAREVRHSILKITPGGDSDRDTDARPRSIRMTGRLASRCTIAMSPMSTLGTTRITDLPCKRERGPMSAARGYRRDHHCRVSRIRPASRRMRAHLPLRATRFPKTCQWIWPLHKRPRRSRALQVKKPLHSSSASVTRSVG